MPIVNYTFSDLKNMTDEQKKKIAETISDSNKFAKLTDETEKVDCMRAYLFIKGAEENKKANGKASDYDIYTEITNNTLLYHTLVSMQKGLDGKKCMEELNGNFISDLAFGTAVGDKSKFKHIKNIDKYMNGAEKGDLNGFYEVWNGEKKAEKANEDMVQQALDKAAKQGKAPAEKPDEVREAAEDNNIISEAPASEEPAVEADKEIISEAPAETAPVKEAPAMKTLTPEQLAELAKQRMLHEHSLALEKEYLRVRKAESELFFTENYNNAEKKLEELNDKYESFKSTMTKRAEERDKLFKRITELEETFADQKKYEALKDNEKSMLMKDYLTLTAHANPLYAGRDKNTQMELDVKSLNNIKNSQQMNGIYAEIIGTTKSGKNALELLSTKYVQKQAYSGFLYMTKEDKKLTETDMKEWQGRMTTAKRSMLLRDPDILIRKKIIRDDWQRKLAENDLAEIAEENERYKLSVEELNADPNAVARAKNALYEAKAGIAEARHQREVDMLDAGITPEQIAGAEKAFEKRYLDHAQRGYYSFESKESFTKRNEEMKAFKADFKSLEAEKAEIDKLRPAAKPMPSVEDIVKAQQELEKRKQERIKKHEEYLKHQKALAKDIMATDPKLGKMYGLALKVGVTSPETLEALRIADEKEKESERKWRALNEKRKAEEKKTGVKAKATDEEIKLRKEIIENKNNKAVLSIASIESSSGAYLGESERANVGIWFGSKKYDEMVKALGDLTNSLDTLRRAEESPTATLDAKEKALKLAKARSDELKKKIERYKRRKLDDRNLTLDENGKLVKTMKGLKKKETNRRLEAMFNAIEMTEVVDDFINSRLPDITKEKEELLHLAEVKEYPKCDLDLSPASKEELFVIYSARKATEMQRQAADFMKSGELDVSTSLQYKRNVVAKIMINEVLTNKEFRDEKMMGIDQVKKHLSALDLSRSSNAHAKQSETMIYDDTFRKYVDGMTNTQVMKFIISPTELTKKYFDDPKRAKTHEDIEPRRKAEVDAAKKQNAMKKNKVKTKKDPALGQ